MNKEELRQKFERNVEYLKRNVPPDDIYLFTEQTSMAAIYFIHKWAEWVDINKECVEDEITRKWLKNILGFEYYKNENIDVALDLDLESTEDE